jgi:hypothetical protein
MPFPTSHKCIDLYMPPVLRLHVTWKYKLVGIENTPLSRVAGVGLVGQDLTANLG